MKMVDYVIDKGDGEEEICGTKREAVKIAQTVANKRNKSIRVQRWFRPDQYSDLEIDEWFDLVVDPKQEEL